MTRKRRRLYILGLFLLGLGTATALTLAAFRDNLVFFYSPSDLATKQIPPERNFRLGGLVDGRVPARHRPRLGIGVERHEDLDALRARVAQALGEALGIEIEAAEIARVGVVLEAEINRVGAVINCRFECGQAACRTDQFRQTMHGRHERSFDFAKGCSLAIGPFAALT